MKALGKKGVRLGWAAAARSPSLMTLGSDGCCQPPVAPFHLGFHFARSRQHTLACLPIANQCHANGFIALLFLCSRFSQRRLSKLDYLRMARILPAHHLASLFSALALCSTAPVLASHIDESREDFGVRRGSVKDCAGQIDHERSILEAIGHP